LTLIIPVDPLPKPRMTRSDKWKQRPCVVRYRDYKDAIRPYATDLNSPVKITFHIAMPASWSKKKRESHDGQFHRQKPDIDNLLKGLMDAWLEEDQEVASVWIEKRWASMGSITISNDMQYTLNHNSPFSNQPAHDQQRQQPEHSTRDRS